LQFQLDNALALTDAWLRANKTEISATLWAHEIYISLYSFPVIIIIELVEQWPFAEQCNTVPCLRSNISNDNLQHLSAWSQKFYYVIILY